MSETITEVGTPFRMSVVEEVRVLLARRRISSTELARRIGWSQSRMSRRMVGEQAFDVDDLVAIASELGVNVVDLLPKGQREVTVAYLEERTAPRHSAPLPRSPLDRGPTGGRPGSRADSRRPGQRPVLTGR